jgi:hypothetical protein
VCLCVVPCTSTGGPAVQPENLPALCSGAAASPGLPLPARDRALPTPRPPQLPEESKVELPLWLAEPLVQRGMVGAAHPKIYAARVQRKMEAGAQCMNIRSKAPYFYTVGMRVNQL